MDNQVTIFKNEEFGSNDTQERQDDNRNDNSCFIFPRGIWGNFAIYDSIDLSKMISDSIGSKLENHSYIYQDKMAYWFLYNDVIKCIHKNRDRFVHMIESLNIDLKFKDNLKADGELYLLIGADVRYRKCFLTPYGMLYDIDDILSYVEFIQTCDSIFDELPINTQDLIKEAWIDVENMVDVYKSIYHNYARGDKYDAWNEYLYLCNAIQANEESFYIDRYFINDSQQFFTNVKAVGCVYFIRDEFTGYVKIGFTKNLARRYNDLCSQIQNMQCRTPCLKIEKIVISLDDARNMESYFHKQFAQYRMDGEWYALPSDYDISSRFVSLGSCDCESYNNVEIYGICSCHSLEYPDALSRGKKIF